MPKRNSSSAAGQRPKPSKPRQDDGGSARRKKPAARRGKALAVSRSLVVLLLTGLLIVVGVLWAQNGAASADVLSLTLSKNAPAGSVVLVFAAPEEAMAPGTIKPAVLKKCSECR